MNAIFPPFVCIETGFHRALQGIPWHARWGADWLFCKITHKVACATACARFAFPTLLLVRSFPKTEVFLGRLFQKRCFSRFFPPFQKTGGLRNWQPAAEPPPETAPWSPGRCGIRTPTGTRSAKARRCPPMKKVPPKKETHCGDRQNRPVRPRGGTGTEDNGTPGRHVNTAPPPPPGGPQPTELKSAVSRAWGKAPSACTVFSAARRAGSNGSNVKKRPANLDKPHPPPPKQPLRPWHPFPRPDHPRPDADDRVHGRRTRAAQLLGGHYGNGMSGVVGYVTFSGAWMSRIGNGNRGARCDFNGNGMADGAAA